jgi:threonine-phosphate decarboxylase
MRVGHGGNIYEIARQINCRPAEIIDVSSNINPLGPPPGLLEFLKENIETITRLPEIDGREMTAHFADYLGIDPHRLLAGNGTTQLIHSMPGALKSRSTLILGPTYSDYADACKNQQVPFRMLAAAASEGFVPDMDRLREHFDRCDTIFICNPNNPTGTLIPFDTLEPLCRTYPQKNFIIDESYLPFVPQGEKESMTHSACDNVMVLHSISKIFGIPGLRVGFVAADKKIIQKFKNFMPPWSVNSLAQTAVRYLAEQSALVESFIRKTRLFLEKQRKQFHQSLGENPGFELYRNQTPFILIKLPQDLSGRFVWERLARERILIRNCGNFDGLSEQFIRVSLKSPEVNLRVAAKLVSLASQPEISFAVSNGKHLVCR